MMNILVLGRSFHPQGKETAKLIADELRPHVEKLGANIEYAQYRDLIFDIQKNNVNLIISSSGKSINDYQTVFMTNWFSHASIRKDIANSVAIIANHNGINLFNTEALHSRSTSKLSQLVHAAYASVDIPRTYFSLNVTKAKDYGLKNGLQYPYIMKDAQASRGSSNYLVTESKIFEQHKEEHSEVAPFIIQECIESDHCDYRYFVVGGKVALVIKRTGKSGSHLNNVSAGGSAELVDINVLGEDCVESVEMISRLLHREVTGIDIMKDEKTGNNIFLEANPIPQIATGAFTSEKLEALAKALVKTGDK